MTISHVLAIVEEALWNRNCMKGPKVVDIQMVVLLIVVHLLSLVKISGENLRR